MSCPHCHYEAISMHEIRQIIREELTHLDPNVANVMLAQLTSRLGRSIQAQSNWRSREIKIIPLSQESEIVQDEY